MKIGIYAICKNEEKHIQNGLKPFKNADVICILDTGSTDNSFQILQNLTVQYENLHIKQQIFNPFYFDDARNAALDGIATFLEETDIVFHFDLDEMVDNNFLDEARIQCLNTTANFFIVDSGTESNGGKGHRLLPNLRGYYHIHEQIVDINNMFHRDTYHIKNTKYVHHQDVTKKRNYLHMLYQLVQENPHSSHYMLYLLVEKKIHNDLANLIDLELKILTEVCYNREDEHFLDAQGMAYAAQDLVDDYSADLIKCFELVLSQTKNNLSKTFFTLLSRAYIKQQDLVKAEGYLLMAYKTPQYSGVDQGHTEEDDLCNLVCFYYYNKKDYIAAYYYATICNEQYVSERNKKNLQYCKVMLETQGIIV